jgi:hypothetical protein
MSEEYTNHAAYSEYICTTLVSQLNATQRHIEGLERRKAELFRYGDENDNSQNQSNAHNRILSGKKRGKLVQINAKLHRLRTAIERHRADIQSREAVWSQMNSVPRVRNITFVSKDLDRPHPELVIETEPLFSLSKEKEWHQIGRVIIVVPLECTNPEKIRWRNVDRVVKKMLKVHTNNGFTPSPDALLFHAPAGVRGKEYGSVSCFGTAYDPITSAMRREDHLALVQILVRYTECTGQHDNARFWPIVKESEVPQWYLENIS